MNFDFFDPGTLDPEAGRRGPRCQNLAFQRFDPMILCSFLWRIRWTTLESHSSEQMMVYKQITFFYKKSKFSKLDFMMKIGSRTRPDRSRPRKTRKTDRKTRKIPKKIRKKTLIFTKKASQSCFLSLEKHSEN